MMDVVNSATPKMDCESEDLPGAWKKFHQHVEFVFKGPLSNKTEEQQCNYLMLWVGEKGRSVFSTWTITEANQKLLDSYYVAFKKYVEPKSNKVFARYKFQSKIQTEAESTEQFIAELKLLVKSCGYASPDEMVRDRIVFGTKSPKVREKLINKGSDLTLENAVEIARLHEMSTAQLKTMAEDNKEAAVHAIHNANASARVTDSKEKPFDCYSCGHNHSRGQCPAYGQRCHRCKGWNHYANKCKKTSGGEQSYRSGQSYNDAKTSGQSYRGKSRRWYNKKSVNMVDDDYDYESDSDSVSQGVSQFFIHTVDNAKSDCAESWKIKIKMNDETVLCKIDTGAQCNVLPKAVFDMLKLGRESMVKSKAKLVAYSGHQLKTVGKTTVNCEYKNVMYPITFQVVENVSSPIIGANTSENELGVIKRVYSVVDGTGINLNDKLTESDIFTKYDDVFTGLGCLEGEVDIKLKDDAQPVVNPPRNVPVAIRETLKDELESMVKKGVLSRVTEPTEWVNSMVTVVKPSGKLRICLDPRNLNQSVQREHYPMNTIDSVLTQVKGAQYFSVLDASAGYWQLKLNEKSSKLCTFNTPFGRFRYCCDV